MRTKSEHKPALQALTVQWQMMLLMATAFARKVLWQDVHNPQRALHDAEKLQMWCEAAMVLLLSQIAAQTTHARTPEDAAALARLSQFVYGLQSLLFVLARMKAQLSTMCHDPELEDVHAMRVDYAAARVCIVPAHPLGYLDSS